LLRGNQETLLAIDIGNTSISYGVFRNGKFLRHGFVLKHKYPQIDQIIRIYGRRESRLKVIISSVNPKSLKNVNLLIKCKLGTQNILIVGRHVKPKINHKYKQINKLGTDRLVNIYGAIRWYRMPLIFINFGTAMTCDVISKHGVYLGGLIIPGMGVAKKALEESAALLPTLSGMKPFKAVLGTNTESCMRAGLLQGFGAMADGLIDRLRKKTGGKARVVVSGGDFKLIAPYIRSRVIVDPYHTLKSLALIYNDMRAKTWHR